MQTATDERFRGSSGFYTCFAGGVKQTGRFDAHEKPRPPMIWSASRSGEPEERVKKYDVERRTRRTRRKTLSIFLCGFRGFCVVRDFFTPSEGRRYEFSQRALRRARPAGRARGVGRGGSRPRVQGRSAPTRT